MKSFLRAVVFILISLAVSGRCFILQQNQTDKASKIEGAESICIENVPYQVIIKHEGAYVCGGALIGPNLVLTAAHCVSGALATKSRLTVVAGTDSTKLYFGHSLFDGSIDIDAEHIKMHPKYRKRLQSARKRNDLALIKLARKFPKSNRIKPISLTKQNVKLNDELTLAGTGRVNPTTRSECLRFYKPKVVDCSIYERNVPSISDIFCHKGESGERTHKGDSGSPMVNSRNELVGIHVSSSSTISIQKAINVYHYLNWIQETINGLLSNEI